jgi:hypothetical protein
MRLPSHARSPRQLHSKQFDIPWKEPHPMSDDSAEYFGTQIAEYRAVGAGGRLTVERSGDGIAYGFRISGLTRSIQISSDEAAELAQAILARTAES